MARARGGLRVGMDATSIWIFPLRLLLIYLGLQVLVHSPKVNFILYALLQDKVFFIFVLQVFLSLALISSAFREAREVVSLLTFLAWVLLSCFVALAILRNLFFLILRWYFPQTLLGELLWGTWGT